MLTDKAYDATVRLGVVHHHRRRRGRGHVDDRPAGDLDEDTIRAAARSTSSATSSRCPTSVSRDQGRRPARLRPGPRRRGGRARSPPRSRSHELDVHGVARAGRASSTSTVSRALLHRHLRPGIARDLGDALGVGGHLTALRRTAVGPFGLDVARTLDQLAERVRRWCRSPTVARAALPAVRPRRAAGRRRRASAEAGARPGHPGAVALFAPDGEFLALYERDGELARPVAVFTG